MGIPEKIDQIVEARKARAQKVRTTAQQLTEIRKTVTDFQSFRDALTQNGNEELANRLNAIVVDRFLTECDETLRELDRLNKRFSRDHVHMSFVGKARQGKSLVMQQISGLDGRIIPSADGSDCTGAKSIITNSESEEIKADITFYRADEIVSIVNDYIAEIFGEAEPKIRLVSEIAGLASRDFQSRLDPKNAIANSKMKHLQNYIDHISEFESELGAQERRTISIGASQIESYVAQYKRDDPSTRYYMYLGVCEANIHCRFPSYSKCGKLVLVDTIGIGDTSIGIEDEMIRAIREDSDAIIYMFRPDVKGPTIDAQHYQLIENISNKVSVDYAKEMLFWVFNRDMSESESKGRLISGLASEVERARERNAVAICKTLDVNCLDTEEVEAGLLTPVLQQMSDRLGSIDDLLINKAQLQLNELFAGYQALCTQIQGAYSKTVSQDVRRQFDAEIETTIDKMMRQIRELCIEREKLSGFDNEKFSSEFNNKLTKVVTRIPNEKQIAEYLDRLLGRYSQHELYIKITQFVRIRIIDDFISLDMTLDELVRGLKRDVIIVLTGQQTGKLGSIVPFSDDDEPDEWLDRMIQTVNNNGYDDISQALQALRNFTMSVKGFFIYPVRNGLEPIDAALHESVPTIEGENPQEQADSIYNWLERYILAVQQKIREGCKDYLSFPNSALYAAARDFWDRASFSLSSLEKQSADVQRKWHFFYEDHIPDIWPEECAKCTNAYRMNEDLDRLVKEMKNYCRKSSFQI